MLSVMRYHTPSMCLLFGAVYLVDADDSVCPQPQSGWVAELQDLAGISAYTVLAQTAGWMGLVNSLQSDIAVVHKIKTGRCVSCDLERCL